MPRKLSAFILAVIFSVSQVVPAYAQGDPSTVAQLLRALEISMEGLDKGLNTMSARIVEKQRTSAFANVHMPPDQYPELSKVVNETAEHLVKAENSFQRLKGIPYDLFEKYNNTLDAGSRLNRSLWKG